MSENTTSENTMSENTTSPAPRRVGPPSRHEMALMIWVAVFPTLTALNFLLRGLLGGAPIVLRTFVLATIAVPIVIYGLMPQLHRARGLLVSRSARS